MEDIKRDTPCPWGSGKRVLIADELTPFQKRWLGYQLIFNKTTPKNLAKRFDLKVELLRKYKQKIINGKPFYSSKGKPCVVDEKG